MGHKVRAPARFEVVAVDGPAHGGPFELEQTTTWNVVDRDSERTLLSYAGEYSASFDGTYDNGSWTGVCLVQLAPDGRHVIVRHATGRVEHVLIPGAQDVAPLSDWTPPPPLPLELDGFVFDQDTDVRELVGAILRGEREVPPGAETFLRHYPVLWLARAHEWLETTPLGPELGTAIGELVRDPDARVSGAAMDFFWQRPLAEGLEPLVARAEEDLRGFGCDWARASIFDSKSPVLSILAKRAWQRFEVGRTADPLDGRIARLLKEAILDPQCPWPEQVKGGKVSASELSLTEAFKGLAFDAAWLAENVVPIETAGPREGRWRGVLNALGWTRRADCIEEVARRLLDASILTPRGVRNRIRASYPPTSEALARALAAHER